MLSFEEARSRILSDVAALGAERVDLRASCGRVLAEDVFATTPQPSFDYSAMDGYALATEDLIGEGPFHLDVIGESRTGGAWPSPLRRGTIMRIFTGAPVPEGADAVLMQEDVQREGSIARFARRPRVGEHIRRAGEDIAAGALALERGTRLKPASIALLASLDVSRVSVARRPVVSIVSTGDELREIGEAPRPGSIVDSNGPALAALVESVGGLVRSMAFARDDLSHTKAALEAALDGADLVLSVGGVSVGDHDVVKPALQSVGIELDFWKVAIKPGKPLVVGRRGVQRYLGLPGNPASAMLTFTLFGAPLVRSMQGDRRALPWLTRARLAADVKHGQGRLEFARARLEPTADGLVAHVFANQASGAITTFASADGFALLPPELGAVTAGTTIDVLRLTDV